MNIKHLKEELERLNLIIANWDDNQEVDAIEQDMALDRLKNLYSEIRFSSLSAKDEVAEPKPFTAPIPVAEESMEEPEEEENNNDTPVGGKKEGKKRFGLLGIIKGGLKKLGDSIVGQDFIDDEEM